VTVRPIDAAGLVLLRREAHGTPSVLLGRRHRDMQFMPGVFVFPGGRIDRSDRRPSGFAEELPAPPARLDRRTLRELIVFARAALRETFEETGLLIGPAGSRAGAQGADGVWDAYRDAGLTPAFRHLRPVARAITPACSPRRYDTRFFLAEGDWRSEPDLGDGELEDLAWVPVTEVDRLPVAEVSALVLAEALAHRAKPGRAAALFRWIGREMRPRFRRA
jgi:8-oxo-dGTP pyrophosphatase MutT (NUDIX family)